MPAPDPTVLDDLIAQLSPLARQHRTQPICWVAGGNDTGIDYCPDCARWKARHLRRRRRYPNASADGGWDDRRASDGPSWCHGCGCALGYSLSEHGLCEELAIWLDDAWCEPLTAEQAYQVLEVLGAARWQADAGILADAITVGCRALRQEADHART